MAPPSRIDTRRWSPGAQRALWFGVGFGVGMVALCVLGVGLAALIDVSSGQIAYRAIHGTCVAALLLVSQVLVVSRRRTRGPHIRWGAYLCGWLAPWAAVFTAVVLS
jgi:hypothetical protein